MYSITSITSIIVSLATLLLAFWYYPWYVLAAVLISGVIFGALAAAGKVDPMSNIWLYSNAGLHTALVITYMPPAIAAFVVTVQIISLIILNKRYFNETVHL